MGSVVAVVVSVTDTSATTADAPGPHDVPGAASDNARTPCPAPPPAALRPAASGPAVGPGAVRPDASVASRGTRSERVALLPGVATAMPVPAEVSDSGPGTKVGFPASGLQASGAVRHDRGDAQAAGLKDRLASLRPDPSMLESSWRAMKHWLVRQSTAPAAVVRTAASDTDSAPILPASTGITQLARCSHPS